ncbi:MAG: hypothetical protein AB8B83_01955 [Bdellovibrionales bacterium]
MSLLKSLLFCATALPFAFSTSVKADIFHWQNQQEGISAAFPDRWHLETNLAYDEVFRISAPAVTDRFEDAQCRMRIRDDGRFKMHSVRNSGAIQRQHYGLEFWEHYLEDQRHAAVNYVKNDTGVARGYASMADLTFESFIQPRSIRRAIAFASHYQNRAYIVECSAEQASFEKWYPSFMGIIKSVDFRSMTPFKNGAYRNFYGDELVVHGAREIDDYIF